MSELVIDPKNTKRRSFLAKLTKGDFGLFKMYWVYGVLAFGLYCLVFMFFSYSIPNIAISLFINSIVGIICVAYSILMLTGTWRASSDYQGLQIWKVLAKLSVLIAFPFVLFAFFGFLGIILQMFGFM